MNLRIHSKYRKTRTRKNSVLEHFSRSEVVAEVPKFMIELEKSNGSDNDKHSKHHKYTLVEPLQDVLEFNDKSDYSDLSD